MSRGQLPISNRDFAKLLRAWGFDGPHAPGLGVGGHVEWRKGDQKVHATAPGRSTATPWEAARKAAKICGVSVSTFMAGPPTAAKAPNVQPELAVITPPPDKNSEVPTVTPTATPTKKPRKKPSAKAYSQNKLPRGTIRRAVATFVRSRGASGATSAEIADHLDAVGIRYAKRAVIAVYAKNAGLINAGTSRQARWVYDRSADEAKPPEPLPEPAPLVPTPSPLTPPRPKPAVATNGHSTDVSSPTTLPAIGRVFEAMVEDPDGRVVLRDEEGELWLARKL